MTIDNDENSVQQQRNIVHRQLETDCTDYSTAAFCHVISPYMHVLHNTGVGKSTFIEELGNSNKFSRSMTQNATQHFTVTLEKLQYNTIQYSTVSYHIYFTY